MAKDNFNDLTPEEEEALKNTTAGQFRELSRHISDVIYDFKDSLVSMRKKIAEKFNVELD